MLELTPLESSALQSELPQLRSAFDQALIQERLESTLFDCKDLRLGNCELQQATYVPGDCCILRYRLAILDLDSGCTVPALVSARIFPSERACDEYARRLVPVVPLAAGRRELRPFAHPVGVIPSLHMVVYAFPLDGELPALTPATDPNHMAAALGAVGRITERWREPLEICRIELVDYGRQHRATLRYVLGQEAHDGVPALDTVVYGKLAADGSGARAGQITCALRRRAEQSSLRFHVPEALGWVPGLYLSLLSAIPGKAGIEPAIKGRLRAKPDPAGAMPLEAMVEASASIAAAVHSSRLDIGPHRSLEAELLWLSRRVAEVRRITPELAERLDPWLDRVRASAAQPAPACAPCHGDFTIGQVLFEGQESGLVDFDSFCGAEPALDLGQFLAYLHLAALNPAACSSMELADSLGRRFLEAYVAHLPGRVDVGQLSERASAYRVVSLVRRAIRSWQKFKPARVEAALHALLRLA